MKATILQKAVMVLGVTGVACALCVRAEEAAEAAPADAEKPAAEQAAAPVAAAGKDFKFLPLMRLESVEDARVEILEKGSSAWREIPVSHYFPYGSEVRLAAGGEGKGKARFLLGPKAAVLIEGSGSFSTAEIAIGENVRTVFVTGGTVGFDFPRTFRDGLVTVKMQDFECVNLAGESRFSCAGKEDGREVVVRVVTGSLGVSGRHFKIARMGAANQLNVFTSTDALMTALRGESGDYKVTLDCGVKSVLDPETGANKDVPQTIEYALSPKCAVKIWRQATGAEAGGNGRMAVAVQTFDAQGKDKNFRVFCEGRANVNSGEMIVPPPVVAKEAGKEKKDSSGEAEEAAGEAAAEGEKAEDGAAKDDGAAGEKKAEGGEAAPAGDGL